MNENIVALRINRSHAMDMDRKENDSQNLDRSDQDKIVRMTPRGLRLPSTRSTVEHNKESSGFLDFIRSRVDDPPVAPFPTGVKSNKRKRNIKDVFTSDVIESQIKSNRGSKKKAAKR